MSIINAYETRPFVLRFYNSLDSCGVIYHKLQMMPVFYYRLLIILLFSLPVFAMGGVNSYAQEESEAINKDDPYRSTTFPLPRFASIAKEKAFVRTGPGKKYPIKWVIEKADIPVEIILEFDVWRKIRDIDGQEGWVFKSLLSGERTAFIVGNTSVSLYASQYINDEFAKVIASLEPSVLVKVEECEGDACYVNAQGFKGWIARKSIWGVYADENFD